MLYGGFWRRVKSVADPARLCPHAYAHVSACASLTLCEVTPNRPPLSYSGSSCCCLFASSSEAALHRAAIVYNFFLP